MGFYLIRSTEQLGKWLKPGDFKLGTCSWLEENTQPVTGFTREVLVLEYQKILGRGAEIN